MLCLIGGQRFFNIIAALFAQQRVAFNVFEIGWLLGAGEGYQQEQILYSEYHFLEETEEKNLNNNRGKHCE